ncbi:flagellin [Bacillus paranthracis]|uniref:flagellin N-terminal helical domain-containing protein n=1 Tax=Bacillus cereus group TaxID=86661 RepID=UPI0022DED940|nr:MULTISPECIES: flagellin [Bacillus cereus group]MDA1890066.1 flagellin [Bacillus cereus group sp. BY11-1LC]MDA2590726.1 flagellin [Bacillus cereus group sp. Bc065]MDK7438957.1 flagellin [Bacillus paranthracis]MDK7455372.1 flagellin [Bacillus paranthracis]
MRINTNINSMRTQEYMRQNQDKINTSMNRLSSGKRINNAADDAAGLAIATRMRSQENGLGVASRNTQDGISLIRTADSALNSVSNILLRMRDLAVQSANGTNSGTDREALNKEFGQLVQQIDYISSNTKFNDIAVLDGAKTSAGAPEIDSTSKKTKDLTVSIVTDSNGGKMDVSLASIKASDLGLITAASAAIPSTGPGDPGTPATPATPKNITSVDDAKAAIGLIDNAMKSLTSSRADLGAMLNRFDFNVGNLNSQASSMAASASQIEDADMAKEMSEMTKFKILNEAGISMLSQANQTPQMVSKLLQ